MKNRNSKIHAVSANKKQNNNNKNKTDAGLASRVRSGEVKIAVYGLGHIGSPLASSWLRAGAHLIGVDNSSKVLENARKGRTHISEPGVNEAFSKGLKEKRFFVYSDPLKASQDSQFKLICVPVLL
jgi:UDP-N-acetyl-D-mannosaminuronate dehydrogenase